MPKEIINGDLEVTGTFTSNDGVPTTLGDLSDVDVPSLGLADDGKHLVARYEVPSTFGDGADLALSLSNDPFTKNAYTDLTANAAQSATVVTVRDTSNFAIDDEVIIHQTCVGIDTSVANMNRRGIYEYGRILSIDASGGIGAHTITLVNALVNSYDSIAGGNIADNIKAQIFKVFNYTTASIGVDVTGRPWDGFSGGFCVMRFNGAVTGASNIDMSWKGFRGGLYSRGAATGGAEGWSGFTARGVVLNPTTFSGGSQGAPGEAGAGGGHLNVGQDALIGSPAGGGGRDYGLGDLNTTINLGGGGGYEDGSGGGGGAAGGVIIVYFADHSGYSGSIISDGEANPPSATPSTAGGGGSGGAVLVNAVVPFAGTISVAGGLPGNTQAGDGSVGLFDQQAPDITPIARWEALKTSAQINSMPVDSDITANRPVGPALGRRFFDTTLGIPIWFDGTNWVDATGSTV